VPEGRREKVVGCEGHAERQGKGVKGVLRGDGEGIALIGEGVGLRGKGEIHGAVGGDRGVQVGRDAAQAGTHGEETATLTAAMGAMKAGEVVGVGDDGATDEDGAADPGAWVGLESSVHSGGRVDSCWGGLEETSEAGSEDSDEHEAKEAKGKPSHGMSRFHWCHCFMPHGIKARVLISP